MHGEFTKWTRLKKILLLFYYIVPIFPPFLPHPSHPLLPQSIPHGCPCPWEIYTCSWISPFPFFQPLSPFLLPFGLCQSLPCFRACGSIFFLKILFIFRKRLREREREGEKHQRVVASRTFPTGDLAHDPDTRPDWESNQWAFGSQACAQSTELHQRGLCLWFYFVHYFILFIRVLL